MAPATGPAPRERRSTSDGTVWLAYRLRRPVDDGRGVGVVVARSADGVVFETVAHRPSTPTPRRCCPRATDDGWRMWLCCHPLDEPDEEDRMTTRLLRSDDGLAWTDCGEVLRGTPGSWDARGARVTAVLSRDPLVVLYDGRKSLQENWFERTGVARSRNGSATLAADDGGPAASAPHGDGALRYATAVALPGGGLRWYAEAAHADGSHDLITSVSPSPGEI